MPLIITRNQITVLSFRGSSSYPIPIPICLKMSTTLSTITLLPQADSSGLSPLARILMSSEFRAEAPKDLDRREKLDRSLFLINSRYLLIALAVATHALIFLSGLVYCERDILTSAEWNSNGILALTYAISVVLRYDVAILLFPTCRTLISMLRRSPLKVCLRTSNELVYHQLIAWSIIFFAWIHTLIYWIHYADLAVKNDQGFRGFLYLNFATGSGWSGHLTLVLVTLIAATSTKWARNRKWRPLCTTHHLFIFVFLFWSLHGVFAASKAENRSFGKVRACSWQYWLGGGLAYLIERVLREVRGRHKVQISKVIQHPSDVIELQMKQKKMTFKAGKVCTLRNIWNFVADDTAYLPLLPRNLNMGTSSVYAHQRP